MAWLEVDVEQKIGQAARTIGPGDQSTGQSWSDALLTMQLALVHTAMTFDRANVYICNLPCIDCLACSAAVVFRAPLLYIH
jgi:hypothetical protein